MSQIGFRNTTYRPARTVLCVTLIASAAFIIVAVDAFRRSGAVAHDKKSGSGGFAFVAESLLPIVHDVNTLEGREALNLNNTNEESALKDVRLVNLRMRPGDDASCLNLYQPRNPKIVAPPDEFLKENRFTFQNSLEKTDNPWVLLDREFPDGAIPVIGDANSLTYVLHLKVGEDLRYRSGATARCRCALRQHLSKRVADVGKKLPPPVSVRTRLSLSFCSTLRTANPKRQQCSKIVCQISASTRNQPKNGSRVFIASKTRTYRRFSCSAV